MELPSNAAYINRSCMGLVGQPASGLNADIKRQAVAKRAPLSKLDVEASLSLHSLKKNLRPALYLDLGRTAPIHN